MNLDSRSVFLEVVDHEEYVEVEPEYGPSGEVIAATPIEGTRAAFLNLRLPDGATVRAQIPPKQLDPILALMIPDFVSLPVRR
jgi:hypothetical protein